MEAVAGDGGPEADGLAGLDEREIVGPFRHTWVFLLAALAIGAAALTITRYYNEHYGRLTPSYLGKDRLALERRFLRPLR